MTCAIICCGPLTCEPGLNHPVPFTFFSDLPGSLRGPTEADSAGPQCPLSKAHLLVLFLGVIWTVGRPGSRPCGTQACSHSCTTQREVLLISSALLTLHTSVNAASQVHEVEDTIVILHVQLCLP